MRRLHTLFSVTRPPALSFALFSCYKFKIAKSGFADGGDCPQGGPLAVLWPAYPNPYEVNQANDFRSKYALTDARPRPRTYLLGPPPLQKAARAQWDPERTPKAQVLRE